MRVTPDQVPGEIARLAHAHDLLLMDSRDHNSGEIVPGLRRLDHYWRGKFDLPWMPRKAMAEYQMLVRRARSNWLRLVVRVLSQRLCVDGFRASSDAEADQVAWARWQANGMDAGQKKLHREALRFGWAYATVWPDAAGSQIRGQSPLLMHAELDSDDITSLTLAIKRWTGRDGARMAVLYDDVAAYRCEWDGASAYRIVDTLEHGLGTLPVVRFANEEDLQGAAESELMPILPIQDRINETLLDRLLAQKFSAFRQRWVTGLAIPEDENGQQVEPFRAMIDRLWVAEDVDTKFGEFDQTDLAPYIAAVSDDVRQMAAISQVPPHFLLGDLANLSAEALVAAESGLKSKVEDKQSAFGESWEAVLRLAALADGDEAGASDTASQVIWRDTEARSQGALVDGLVKLASVGVPLEFILEQYGLTPQTVTRVLEMKTREDRAKASVTAAAFGVEAAHLSPPPTPVSAPMGPMPPMG